MSAPLLLLVGLAVFLVFLRFLRCTVPLALAAAAVVCGIAGTLEFPFRHLVEGTFGYLNLILALFAGAWFGQAASRSGFADGFARGLLALTKSRPMPSLAAIALLLFAAGMFTGLAGIAVLTVGAFAAPVLRRIGLPAHEAAAFIAVEATCGMIAPPVNVPAMMIADGVNMPFLNFARTLLALSVPPALAAIALFARRCPLPGGDAQSAQAGPPGRERSPLAGTVPLALVLGFWLMLRLMPERIFDPGVPVVLVAGGLVLLPFLGARSAAALREACSGVPLYLAAALASVGMLVQIMTLTGMRGWLVIQTMASHSPWLQLLLIGLPVLGGVLTSPGTSNVLGVPFAFAFIHQDMIINVSALSTIAALSEFMPPTAVGAALAGYVVGEGNLMKIFRAALPALALLFALALALIVFAKPLAPLLTAT